MPSKQPRPGLLPRPTVRIGASLADLFTFHQVLAQEGPDRRLLSHLKVKCHDFSCYFVLRRDAHFLALA